MVKHTAIGALIGIAVFALLIVFCAFALTAGDFDENVASPLSNICLSLGAVVGGFVSALLHKSKGLIIGAAVGLTMFIVITLAALIISGYSVTLNTPLRLVLMPMISAVGGIIGVNKTAKRKMI